MTIGFGQHSNKTLKNERKKMFAYSNVKSFQASEHLNFLKCNKKRDMFFTIASKILEKFKVKK